ILSVGTIPSGTLQYRSNDGGLYASFRAGKNNNMWEVPVYRMSGDTLVREVSLLYFNMPMTEPAGFRHVDPVGLSRTDFGEITHLNTLGTVASYGVCAPAQ